MPAIILATARERLRKDLTRALGRTPYSLSAVRTGAMLRDRLPKSQVAVIDLGLPGLTPADLIEMGAAAAGEPRFILLWDTPGDLRRIQDFPLNRCATMLRPVPASRHRAEVMGLAESILRFVSREHGGRILHAFYDAARHEIVTIFRDGRVYRLRRRLIPEDDGSRVLRVRIEPDGSAFAVEQSSGNSFEIPWDFVLYHLEPGYSYYKGRSLQKKREAYAATVIGRRVRELRHMKGLTTYELARRSGMHRPNVSRIEQGKHLPSIDTLGRLARALRVSVSDLL